MEARTGERFVRRVKGRRAMSVISFGPEFREALTVGPFTHDRYDSDEEDDVLGDTPFKHRRSGDYDTGFDSPVKLRPAQSAPAADLSYAPPTPGGRAFRRQASDSSTFDEDDVHTEAETQIPESVLNTGYESAVFDIPSTMITLNGVDCTFTMPEIGILTIEVQGHTLSMSIAEMYVVLEHVLGSASSTVPAIFGAKGMTRIVFDFLFGRTPAQRKVSVIVVFSVMMIFVSSWLCQKNHELWEDYNKLPQRCNHDGSECWKVKEITTKHYTNETHFTGSTEFRMEPPPFSGFDTAPESLIVSLLDAAKNYMVSHVSAQFDWLKRDIAHHTTNAINACLRPGGPATDIAGRAINCPKEAKEFFDTVTSALIGILRLPAEGLIGGLARNVTIAFGSSLTFDSKKFMQQIGIRMDALELVEAFKDDVHEETSPPLQKKALRLRAASPRPRARDTHPCGDNPTWQKVGRTGRKYCVDSKGYKWNEISQRVDSDGVPI
jgi:hypothetical protein